MKTLLKKLRLSEEDKLVVLHRPDASYFAQMQVSETLTEPTNYIVIFVKTLEELVENVMSIVANDLLLPNGRLFIAYAKKGNKKYPTFVHRDAIFPALKVDENEGYIANSDYKFNQMVSLDDTFTIVGLKKEIRKQTTQKKPSQCVSDYEGFIPELKKELSVEKEALLFFNQLTEGYKRNWARYIYSAQRQETRQKRLAETIDLLKKGVKTK